MQKTSPVGPHTDPPPADPPDAVPSACVLPAADPPAAVLPAASPPGCGGYTRHDTERRVPEDHSHSARTPFERDRARVLHSSALRRLGAKTQVLGPGSDDFARTRLTHSLEVAQVGRAVAQALGCDPDVVDAACLSHDLGHPPFGHNGERALDTVAAGIGGFEGNAQTFRILTRLEPKTLDAAGGSVGLNLTRAVLDAVAKYPWARGRGPGGARGRSARKYSVYDDDAAFTWVRTDAPGQRRCLEAQVMDLSDDVAYSVHDVEDAIALGLMDPSALGPREVESVVEATRGWYGEAVGRDALGAAWERLAADPAWIRSYDGGLVDAAALKNLTSQLIGRFVSAVAAATRQAFGDGDLTRYAADLVVPADTAAEILVLKGAAVRYVMAPREHEPVYLRQRTTLFDLADVLMGSGGSHLDPLFAEGWHRARDEGGRLRVVVDQLASLTDTSARSWHARLCGMFSAI